VILLLLQRGLRNEDWEVAVLNSQLLDLSVKECLKIFRHLNKEMRKRSSFLLTKKKIQVNLNSLPNGIRPRPEDVTTGHIVVFEHFGFGDDLRVPVGQALLFLSLHAESRLLLSRTGVSWGCLSGLLFRLWAFRFLRLLGLFGLWRWKFYITLSF